MKGEPKGYGRIDGRSSRKFYHCHYFKRNPRHHFTNTVLHDRFNQITVEGLPAFFSDNLANDNTTTKYNDMASLRRLEKPGVIINTGGYIGVP
jgi:hypothetical protein